MKFKLKGRTLLSAEIISPDMPIAEFSEGYSKQGVKTIVANLNYGSEMLSIYKKYRNSLHIVNVVEMLNKMEEVYQRFDTETYEIKRSNENL